VSSNLPAVGSVWGVVDGVKTWRRFCGVDDDRGYHWETWRGEFFEAELRIESGAVDITAIVSDGVDAIAKLEFLGSKGLTVGTMQESGKDPYLAYVIEPGSELCDLETVNKLVDAEIRSNKYEAELKRCAEIVQRVYVGGVSGIGLLNVADALQEIFADKIPKRMDTEGRDVTNLPVLWSEEDTITDMSQPFTVEWLCEIGGRIADSAVFFESPEGIQFDYWSTMKRWALGGATLGVKITTRGDVLKWLDVLGIVPATTPKQAAEQLAEQFTRDGQMGTMG
jgi:hypothetical protein